MAFDVIFYKFSKRPNSTAVPVVEGETAPTTPSITMLCALKEQTSMLNPILVIDYPGQVMPTEWNYIQIPIFQFRYYFVEDWVNRYGTIWEARCSIDVLGTYRADIAASTQFIERSSIKADLTIPDSLAPGISVIDTARTIIDSPFHAGLTCIIAEITGMGTSRYYRFSDTGLDEFLRRLFSDDYADSVMPGWQDAFPQFKAALNPLQYIGTVRKYFLDIPGAGVAGTIPVGWGEVPTGLAQYMPDNYIAQQIFEISAPPHPNGGITFQKSAPYSEYTLFFPPFGELPLDAGVIGNNPNIRCVFRVDYISGIGYLLVFGGSPQILLGTAEARIGIDMKISQTFSQGWGAVNAISAGISIAGNLASGNIGGAAGSIIGGIDNFLGNMTPKHRAIGSNGGSAAQSGEIVVMGRFQSVKMPSKEKIGYNYYKMDEIINHYPGYIKVGNADIKINGTETEAGMIEDLMNGGFFYE